jgi:holo-[acyl-carrier protein] synthase
VPIVGHGIDLVETERIARMLADHPERFLERCFTPREVEDSEGVRRFEHLAARFAAKEAALKAIGTGWARGIGWTDVETVRHESGRPELRVHGKAAEIAAELGVTRWHVSLTHTAAFAAASVIAEA